jgi:VWFA-related protein
MSADPVSTVSKRVGGVLAILALAAISPRPVTGAATPPQPVVSSEVSVTLVELPVEVMRNGEPVTDLTAADFAVTEGKRPLPIVAFEPVDLGTAEEPKSPPVSLAARRHILFLFDFAFSQPQRLEEGVAAARELVATGLDPRDLVAVGIYLPKGELQLLLSFTTDRAAAARVLGALADLLNGKAPAKTAGEADPLRLTGIGARSLLSQAFRVDERNAAAEALASLGSPRASGTSGPQTSSLREGFLQRNVLYHSAVVQQPEVDSRQRGHVMDMAEALEGLAEVLRPVTGRKYLALFSEGFSMQLAEAEGGVQTPSGGGSLMLGKLNEMVEELRRSGWVLHAVNLTGVRGGLSADGLFFLARETGGELVEGTNRLAQGLTGALRRSAHGYLITVQVDDVALDGAYHKVDVRLREPRHAKVRSLGGYFAPLPFSHQKDVQRLAEAATLVAGEEERDDLGVQVVAVPLRAGADSTPVAVVVEVPGKSLLVPGVPRVGLEVYGYCLDAGGNSVDFFAQAMDFEVAKLGGRLAQGGVRVLGRLDLPPGEHRLRVLVRDRGNGRLSLLSVPLRLANGDGARVEALFLPPKNDPWILVRGEKASFDVHGRAVLPAAHGFLPATGEAQVLILGRGLTGKGTWVKERILSNDGRSLADGALDLLSVTPGENGEPDLVMGRLRAGTLPPGSYLLELRIGGDTGAARAVTVRPFVIAGASGPGL